MAQSQESGAVAKEEREPPETYRLLVDDRFEHMVREDHAPNSVLHNTLREFDGIEQVDLMGSHARGEKPREGRPTYHVWVEFRNEGGGHPIIEEPVSTMVDRGVVKVCKVVECSDDHLIVALRPIERTVRPVVFEESDLPKSIKERLNGDDGCDCGPNEACSECPPEKFEKENADA